MLLYSYSLYKTNNIYLHQRAIERGGIEYFQKNIVFNGPQSSKNAFLLHFWDIFFNNCQKFRTSPLEALKPAFYQI